MNYDNELIKDLIIEKEPTINREDIVIEKVHSGFKKEMILIDFYTTIIKDVHGTQREFIKRQNHTFEIDEYNKRLTQRIRDNKLKELGI